MNPVAYDSSQMKMQVLGSKCLFVILAFVMTASAWADDTYPNEIEGYKFYEKYCAGLKPMSSSRSNVIEVMGKPSKDMSTYMEYEKDGWTIFVFLYTSAGKAPAYYVGRIVESIDFLPKVPLPFEGKKFSEAFRKHDSQGYDASWLEFHDVHGLCYQVYTSKTPHGKEVPGDLNRISYRASPQEIIRMQNSIIRDFKSKETTKE